MHLSLCLRLRAVHGGLCTLALYAAAFLGGDAQPVYAAPPAGKSNIVALATAYIDSLSDAQRNSTVVSNNVANVAHWSNRPAKPDASGTNNLRYGIAYSALTAAQKVAWTNLVKAALGDPAWDRFQSLRAADDYLGTLDGRYSGSYEYVAFAGTPSAGDNWVLQVGGHYNARNYCYRGDTLQTATPYYIGSEPAGFTGPGGVTHAPLAARHDAMYALAQSLTGTQIASARLSGTNRDVRLGPGMDARSYFPTKDRGVLASSLTRAQQTLVLNAIKAWVNDAPPALAAAYLALYQSELADTYVGIGRASPTSTAAPDLTVPGDYVRIDGPHVWIEIASLAGVVLPSNTVHYRTVWRDRVSDYDAAYRF